MAIDVKPAAVLLRFLWPVFFALIGVLGLVGAVTARKQKAGLIVNGATVSGMMVCFLLVPLINDANDNDHMGLWNTLHLFTVGVTFILLTMHLGYAIRWYQRK